MRLRVQCIPTHSLATETSRFSNDIPSGASTCRCLHPDLELAQVERPDLEFMLAGYPDLELAWVVGCPDLAKTTPSALRPGGTGAQTR